MTQEAPGTEMIPAEPPSAISLGAVSASTPGALVAGATEAANALVSVVDSRKLYSMIQGRKYVRVEGWLTLATMMGCLPYEVSNEADEDGVYVATVELRRMSDGAVLARASAEAGAKDEKKWGNAPAYQRRSMASTRATGKVCRTAFAWVMALAGYATTPAEEMDGVDCGPQHAPPQSSPGSAPGCISQPQVKRLFAIAREHKVPDDEVKRIVTAAGYEHTRDIKREDYEGIVSSVEAWGKDALEGEVVGQGAVDPDDDLPF